MRLAAHRALGCTSSARLCPRRPRFNAATVRLFRLLLARTAAAARGSQSPESRPRVQTPNWPPVLWVLPGLGVLFEGVSATGLVVLLPVRPSRFASLLLLARRRRLRDGVAHSRRRWRQLLCIVSDLKGTVSRASGCRAPPARPRTSASPRVLPVLTVTQTGSQLMWPQQPAVLAADPVTLEPGERPRWPRPGRPRAMALARGSCEPVRCPHIPPCTHEHVAGEGGPRFPFLRLGVSLHRLLPPGGFRRASWGWLLLVAAGLLAPRNPIATPGESWGFLGRVPLLSISDVGARPSGPAGAARSSLSRTPVNPTVSTSGSVRCGRPFLAFLCSVL